MIDCSIIFLSDVPVSRVPRVSSEKGKSFLENFAFFAFRLLTKNPTFFVFIISHQSVSQKNAKISQKTNLKISGEKSKNFAEKMWKRNH